MPYEKARQAMRCNIRDGFGVTPRSSRREEQLVSIMVLLECYVRAVPSMDQAEQIVEIVERAGGDIEALRDVLASGRIPPDLYAITQEMSQNWRPSGEIVEADQAIPRLLSAPSE
jgi:hypothetical protein